MIRQDFILPIFRSLIGKIALLIFVVWGANTLWHLYNELSAKTPMLHVIAEFEVEGEYVKIDKKIRCYPQGQGGELSSQDLTLNFKFWKSGPRYTGKQRMLGAHLKNGGALLVYTPINACRYIWSSILRNAVKKNIIPEFFVPSTALVYDFDDPDKIKHFASKTAYLQKDAEVKPLSYSVTQAEKWSLWDFPDEFNWVSKDNGTVQYYSAAYLEFMPFQMFAKENAANISSQNPVIPTMLNEMPEYELPKRLWWNLDLRRTITNILTGHHYAGRELVPGASGDEFSVDNYYPLVIENGVFKPDLSQRGVWLYRKFKEKDLKQSTSGQGKSLSSRLYGHQFRLPDQIQIDQSLLKLILYKSEEYDPEKNVQSKMFLWPKTNRVYRLKHWPRKFYY